MIAGRGRQDFSFVKNWAKENPRLFYHILDALTHVTTEYLIKQVDAGACAVQLFDTWAGFLSVEDYNALAKPYTDAILARLKQDNVPSIHFVRNGGHLLDEMLTLSSDVVSIGNDVKLCDVYEKMCGKQQAVQGNLKPEILLIDKKTIKEETQKMFSCVPDPCQGYIVNLSHGVLPETPVENVKWFVECAKNLG